MRKNKEIKRKRELAGIDYKKGNRKDAYTKWAEAAKEMRELRAPKKKPAEGGAASS